MKKLYSTVYGGNWWFDIADYCTVSYYSTRSHKTQSTHISFRIIRTS